MISFTGHLETSVEELRAFELLADMDQLDRWNPNVTESTRTSGERLAVGSTYRSTIRRGPLRFVARSELVEVDSGRSVTHAGSISVMWSVDSLRFEPTGDGTCITFENQTRLPGWMQPLSPALNAAFQTQAKRAVEGARRYLESR